MDPTLGWEQIGFDVEARVVSEVNSELEVRGSCGDLLDYGVCLGFVGF
jgi:hypothetical protein